MIFFCKLCAPTHALNHLLPPTRTVPVWELEDIHTSCQTILLIFIRNLFSSVLYIALSSEIVLYSFFWFCCFVLYVILTLLFVFVVWCEFVASNKYYIHTYIKRQILILINNRYYSASRWHSGNVIVGNITFLMIFAVFDPSPLTRWINCSFLIFMGYKTALRNCPQLGSLNFPKIT